MNKLVYHFIWKPRIGKDADYLKYGSIQDWYAKYDSAKSGASTPNFTVQKSKLNETTPFDC